MKQKIRGRSENRKKQNRNNNCQTGEKCTDRQTDGKRQFGKIEEYVSHQTAKLKDDQQGDQIKSLMY